MYQQPCPGQEGGNLSASYGDDAVAWFCTYTPLEILDAAGLVPMRHFGDPASLESADTYLHPAICPYVRACLAAALAEEAPHHAVFVNSCDGMRRLYDAWKDRFRDDFVYLMDFPRNPGDMGRRILVEEYRSLIGALAEAWGGEVTAAGLREAAARREGRRLAFQRAAAGIYGEARLSLAMQAHSLPLAEALPPVPETDGERGVPVLLTGNLLNPAGLVASLERAGARVVFSDLCNGDRAFSSSTVPQGDDLDGLLDSLAMRYLDRHPCARMADSGRRYELLVETAEAAGARGVIYASLKFCDSYLYDFPRVQERLKREGIPLLRLESDYADGHVGQLLTRVEAFVEML